MDNPRQPPAVTDAAVVPWYRVPLVWFAIVLMGAILAGCIHFIVLSIDHADPAVSTGETVMRMPTSAAPAPAQSTRSEPARPADAARTP